MVKDAAERGVYIDGMSPVGHVEVLQDPKDYLYCLARTARISKSGAVVALTAREQRNSLSVNYFTCRCNIQIIYKNFTQRRFYANHRAQNPSSISHVVANFEIGDPLTEIANLARIHRKDFAGEGKARAPSVC